MNGRIETKKIVTLTMDEDEAKWLAKKLENIVSSEEDLQIAKLFLRAIGGTI